LQKKRGWTKGSGENLINVESEGLLMDLKKAFGITASSILIILGLLFAIASIRQSSRLIVGIIMVGSGFGILYLLRKRDKERRRLEIPLPGRFSVQSLRCPNCSGELDASQMKMKGGVPIIECPYCGSSIEVTEEPKW